MTSERSVDGCDGCDGEVEGDGEKSKHQAERIYRVDVAPRMVIAFVK